MGGDGVESESDSPLLGVVGEDRADRGQEDRVAHRVEPVDRGDLGAQVLAHDVGHRGERDAVHVPDRDVDPVDQQHEPPLRIQAELSRRFLLQFHSIQSTGSLHRILYRHRATCIYYQSPCWHSGI